jgi:hypothetical protein
LGAQTSNYMKLTRVQWGRSSRTDKGVSSLALVISLRMLCPPDAFPGDEDDEEEEEAASTGNFNSFDPTAPMLTSQLLVDQINAHLPPEVPCGFDSSAEHRSRPLRKGARLAHPSPRCDEQRAGAPGPSPRDVLASSACSRYSR